MLVALGIVSLLASSAADAANRRVAISDYSWSQRDISLDLGERVTWYWTGPDTAHSVTGDADSDASGLDSDSQTASPRHPVGDSFSLTFSSPGIYSFHCKLHSFVRGTVTVSGSPGDPDTEADPIPPNNVDTTAPVVNSLSVTAPTFAARRGTELFFALDERSSIDAEIWRLKNGRPKVFAGWRIWPEAFIGFNWLEFGTQSRNFKAKPGRYRAFVYATDEWNNESRPGTVDFTIR